MGTKGYLILENGMIFEGNSCGAQQSVSGEVVFTTGMVGYPEGFTDPSFFGQILVETYPLIGNYGVPPETIRSGIKEFYESDRIQIRGLIVSSLCNDTSHWQTSTSLSAWLKKESIPALEGIDTRMLTTIIREKGVMKGIITFTKPSKNRGFIFEDINKKNIVQYVSTDKIIRYGKGNLAILLIDCGLKLNQIRLLVERGITVIRTPWNYNPFTVKSPFLYDGIIISNGPGDPKMAKETIQTVKVALLRKIPTLGICLGNQILALAAGADTYKLKYGHRGQNQPVFDQMSGKSYITTQNHGFAVNTDSLPQGFIPWFTNLNDNTNEGIRHKAYPFFSVQFHPESSPGPTDTEWIFDYFLSRIEKWQKKN